MNPPPDVIFAQKATAIVKAAGMDPRSIDLEKFRLNAPLVFSRAYSAIYKEKLPSLLNEKSTKDEKILNSQLVLDGLFTKTRNPVLRQLTGTEIYLGNHKAIGVLVGILFAEGQRLWLEKIRAMEAEAQPPTQEDSADFDQIQRMQDANDLLARDEEVNSLNDNDLNKSNGFDGQDIRSSLKTLNKLRSNPDIGPADLERLLSRIAFLEEQLQRKTVKKSKSSSHKGTRSSKKNVGNRIADAILRDNEINQRLFDESSEEGAFQTTGSSPGRRADDRREYVRTSASSRSPTLKRPMSGNGMGIAEVRKSRPTSAPSTSNRKINKIRHPSNRLYSAAPNRHREAEATETLPERTKGRGRNQTPEPAATIQVVKEKEIFDPSIHTYDWKSGRKILIAQAQAEYEERKRSKEAMDQILALSDNAVDAMMGGGDNSRPTSPVKAEYPSKSISGDVDKWLQRMRRDRYGERKPPPKVEDVPMPEPRFFAAYQKLEDRDLVITIEHCFNCQHHNVTTRHKQDDYVNNSSSFLRALAQMAHESGVCARVGVSRFKANVTEKCSTSDSDSRIGAFEIQVAYKTPNGKVVPKILHSKLMTRCWPSKNVLEKRFRAFIASAKVSTLNFDSEEASSTSSVHMANDSTEPYPVGASTWVMSPVANPAWSFALNEVQLAAGSNAPMIAGPAASSAQLTANAIPSVQWAFDMRELSESPPKFTIGSTIRVNKLNFSSGCTERHALLAVVKDYADPNDPHASDIVIKPMYQAQEVRVPQRNCVNLSHYSEERAANFAPGEVPVELQVLCLLAKQHKMFAWDVARGEGRKEANGDVCLSRKAFYNQVRKLVWALEKKLAPRGKYLLAHPDTGEEVDIQFCYSEVVMDWVFETFKGEGNVSALERLATQPAAAPQTPSTKSPSSKHNESTPGSVANSVKPTPREESHAGSTGNNTARSAALPVQPPNSARTAVTARTAESSTPQLFGTVVEVEESTLPGQEENNKEPAPIEPQSSPVMESNDDAARVEQEPSALTMESDLDHTAPSVTSPGQTTTERTSKDENTSSEPVVSVSADPNPSQTPLVSSRRPNEAGNQSARTEASAPAATADQAPPPTPANTVEEPSPLAESTSAALPSGEAGTPSTAVSSKPVSKSSTLPTKRFSSADLVGAADQALKNKVITSLCLPGQAHNPALTAMERMSILYQLADVMLDEAVLESDEKAELSQGPFLDILRNYGVGPLLDNPAVAGALLAKASTSSSTPDKPAAVEVFMNWLQAGDSVKRRTGKPSVCFILKIMFLTSVLSCLFAASALEKSKSETAVAVVPAKDTSAEVNQHAEENSPLAESIELPAASPSSPTRTEATPATPANTEASSAAMDHKTTSGKESPRGEIATTSQPNSVRSMGGTGTAANTARSTVSADDPEALLRKEEERRKSLNYQPKEMQFSTVVIEGDQLVHTFYDTVMVQVKIGKDQWVANTCLQREKGSKRRTFAVKWPEFMVSADTFRDDVAFVTVAVSDSAVTEANSAVPSLATSVLGESNNSVKIPLYLFMVPTFDVQREVSVTPVVVAKAGAPPSSGTIKVTIHGHARDPKGLRTARIMSMRPQDLMNIKFDPILPLDDGDEDIYESDAESDDEDSPVKKKSTPAKATESPQDALREDELTRTLYPKASVHQMVTVASVVTTTAAAGDP